MKNRILVLFFLFSVLLVNGQIQNKLNETYYLLGTLDDYMGRVLCIKSQNDWNYIMHLFQKDSGKIKRIEEVTMLKFIKGEKKEDCITCREFYVLSSFTAASEINSFYVFKKGNECQDANRISGTIYSGKLKCSKILKASKDQQYSFLAGLFLIYGENTNNVYKITLSNSPWRYECTIKILKVLNSKNVSFRRTGGTVPIGYFIEFEPSEELKLILDNEIEKRAFSNEKL
jgi:hypothetical protein